MQHAKNIVIDFGTIYSVPVAVNPHTHKTKVLFIQQDEIWFDLAANTHAHTVIHMAVLSSLFKNKAEIFRKCSNLHNIAFIFRDSRDESVKWLPSVSLCLSVYLNTTY